MNDDDNYLPFEGSERAQQMIAFSREKRRLTESVINAARECEHWRTQAEDSLGPPQEAAWAQLYKAFGVLRAALAALDAQETA